MITSCAWAVATSAFSTHCSWAAASPAARAAAILSSVLEDLADHLQQLGIGGRHRRQRLRVVAAAGLECRDPVTHRGSRDSGQHGEHGGLVEVPLVDEAFTGREDVTLLGGYV